jgi:hypothetical protein
MPVYCNPMNPIRQRGFSSKRKTGTRAVIGRAVAGALKRGFPACSPAEPPHIPISLISMRPTAGRLRSAGGNSAPSSTKNWGCRMQSPASHQPRSPDLRCYGPVVEAGDVTSQDNGGRVTFRNRGQHLDVGWACLRTVQALPKPTTGSPLSVRTKVAASKMVHTWRVIPKRYYPPCALFSIR